MKTASCTDRELLLGLKRLCTEKNCFRNAKPDEAVLDYYKGIMKMVDEELKKDAAPDTDRVETIIFNMFTVIGNAALHFEGKAGGRRKTPIAFAATDVDCAKVCHFLDTGAKITRRYSKVENRQKRGEFAGSQKRRKGMRFFTFVPWILLIIAVLIFISGVIASNLPRQPEAESILTGLTRWYKYDLRKQAEPVPIAEEWSRLSKIAFSVIAAVSVAWIGMRGILKCWKLSLHRRDQRIRQSWNDYQNLCAAFEMVSSQMNELEW